MLFTDEAKLVINKSLTILARVKGGGGGEAEQETTKRMKKQQKAGPLMRQ